MKSAKTVRLGDVCEVLDSRRQPITQKDRKPGPIPYYGATGIVDHVADYIFDEPLLLLGEDGAKWGACENSAFLIDGKAWVNNHAHVLRTKPQLDRKFAMYYLNMADLSEYITGVTVPKLNQARMCTITLPLPPLSVQRAIVARLDSALARAGALEERFAAIAQNAELSFKASLNEEFAGRTGGTGGTSGTGGSSDSRSSSTSRNPSDPSKPWPLVRLGDVCEVPFAACCSLKRGSYTTQAAETPGNIPVILGGQKPAYYIARFNHEGRCLVVSRSGASAGFVSRWEEPIFVTDGFIIEVDDEVMDFEYAYLFFQSQQETLNGRKQGGAIPHVTGKIIESLSIPLPPLTSQRSIVARLDAARTRYEKVAALARRAAEACAMLRKALLKEAFE